MAKLKITFISGSWPPIKCGVGDYLFNLVNNLKDEEVSVITSIGAKRSKNILAVVPSWKFSSWGIINDNLIKTRPDIVHFQYPTVPYGRRLFPNILPWLIRFRIKTPSVITLHEYHNASWLGKKRIELTARPFKNIIVSNIQDQVDLKDKFRNKKIHIIRVGTNIAVAEENVKKLQKIKNKYNPRSREVVLYFGYIDPSKGIENLIESMIDWPANTRLIIATRYDSTNAYHKKLKDIIDKSEGDIVWTGYLPDDDVSRLMTISDVVCLPFSQPVSMRRGSMIAAMVHSKPIITTGPSQEVLKHNRNCWLMNNNSATEISKAVNRVIGDRELAKKLAKGSGQSSSDFMWSKIAEAHTAVYDLLIKT